jgi:hypothetical protein
MSKYVEPPLRDGNYVRELYLAEQQAKAMTLTAEDTLEIDIKIDDDIPEAMKEQIREVARRRIEKATGAKVVTKKAVVLDRVAKMEKHTLDVSALAQRLTAAEEEIGKMKTAAEPIIKEPIK